MSLREIFKTDFFYFYWFVFLDEKSTAEKQANKENKKGDIIA